MWFGALVVIAVVAFSAADDEEYFQCVMTSDRAARCWGFGGRGVLGLGNSLSIGGSLSRLRSAYGDIQVGAPIISLHTGKGTVCAITTGQQLRCWGSNDESYLLGHSVGYNGVIGVTEHPSAYGTVPLGGNGAIRVLDMSLGKEHACIVSTTKQLKCWGDGDGSGSLGYGYSPNIITSPAAAPGWVNLGAGVTGVLQVANGEQHTCILTDALRCRCWGDNGYSQLGLPSSTARIATAASAHMLPLSLGGGALLSLVAAAEGSTSCVLGVDLEVYCWGGESEDSELWGQVPGSSSPLPGLPADLALTTVSLDMSKNAVCAVHTNNKLSCWGIAYVNGFSRSTRSISPRSLGLVPVGADVLSVRVRPDATCVVTTTLGVRCWGFGAYGQLGYGNLLNTLPPVPDVPLGALAYANITLPPAVAVAVGTVGNTTNITNATYPAPRSSGGGSSSGSNGNAPPSAGQSTAPSGLADVGQTANVAAVSVTAVSTAVSTAANAAASAASAAASAAAGGSSATAGSFSAAASAASGVTTPGASAAASAAGAGASGSGGGAAAAATATTTTTTTTTTTVSHSGTLAKHASAAATSAAGGGGGAFAQAMEAAGEMGEFILLGQTMVQFGQMNLQTPPAFDAFTSSFHLANLQLPGLATALLGSGKGSGNGSGGSGKGNRGVSGGGSGGSGGDSDDDELVHSHPNGEGASEYNNNATNATQIVAPPSNSSHGHGHGNSGGNNSSSGSGSSAVVPNDPLVIGGVPPGMLKYTRSIGVDLDDLFLLTVSLTLLLLALPLPALLAAAALWLFAPTGRRVTARTLLWQSQGFCLRVLMAALYPLSSTALFQILFTAYNQHTAARGSRAVIAASVIVTLGLVILTLGVATYRRHASTDGSGGGGCGCCGGGVRKGGTGRRASMGSVMLSDEYDRRLEARSQYALSLGVLCHRYKPQFWFLWLVQALSSVATAVVVVLVSGGAAQVTLVFALHASRLLLLLRLQPYRKPWKNRVYTVLSAIKACSTATLVVFLSPVGASAELRTRVTYAVVGVNSACVLLFLLAKIVSMAVGVGSALRRVADSKLRARAHVSTALEREGGRFEGLDNENPLEHRL